MPSPIGELTLVAKETALVIILWKDQDVSNFYPEAGFESNHPVLQQAQLELDEYFSKKRKAFQVPIHFSGTPFQNRVWTELQNIPFGETISYEELAIRLGDVKAIRAVGTANGKNPIPIIIPCHRVIGKNGKLTGFGGGLDTKAFLLKLEQAPFGLFAQPH